MTTVATNVPFGSNIVYIPLRHQLRAVFLHQRAGVGHPASRRHIGFVQLHRRLLSTGSLWSIGSLAINQGATLALTVHPTVQRQFCQFRHRQRVHAGSQSG